MGKWMPIETAPASTPADQTFFLAYCPNDSWAPLGNIHIACRYVGDEPNKVQVIGSPQKRIATMWMIPETPKAA